MTTPEPSGGVRVASPTEQRNERTLDLDAVPTSELLARLNAEDQLVAPAVARSLDELAALVDTAVERYRAGGRVHYFGAGTSGRLATLDAAELPPTFSIDPDRVVAHLAGGGASAEQAQEGIEDDPRAGADDAAGVGPGDVVVGIAASGRTPYVGGALSVARGVGAYTALVSSNPDAELAAVVDRHVCVPTGPEPLTGSTRMKAGTAAKLVLNSFSTALMVRLGKTYSNLMVDVTPGNEKLRGRVRSILVEATGEDEQRCVAVLDAAGGDPKAALVCLLADVEPADARAALDAAGGGVRAALDRLDRNAPR